MRQWDKKQKEQGMKQEKEINKLKEAMILENEEQERQWERKQKGHVEMFSDLFENVPQIRSAGGSRRRGRCRRIEPIVRRDASVFKTVLDGFGFHFIPSHLGEANSVAQFQLRFSIFVNRIHQML